MIPRGVPVPAGRGGRKPHHVTPMKRSPVSQTLRASGKKTITNKPILDTKQKSKISEAVQTNKIPPNRPKPDPIALKSDILKFNSDGDIVLRVREGNRPNEDEGLCLLLIDKYREENGLPPLIFLRALSNLEVNHTIRLMTHEIKLGHDGFLDRASVIPKMKGCGENVGLNFGHPDYVETMVRGWINSPGHKANILGNYNVTGIVFRQNSIGEWYGTQIFARIPLDKVSL